MSELALIPNAETPDIEAMPRADLPAIWQGFRSDFERLANVAETLTVTDAGQRSQMVLAATTRKSLKRLRGAIETKRKELTDYHLKVKQGIDASARVLKELIEPLEARMLELEQFAERQEAERKDALKRQRMESLSLLGVLETQYRLDEMTEAEFDALYEEKMLEAEARMEAEQKAKQEQIAREKTDAEERDRLRIENERLKAEAIEREAAAALERAEAERARMEAEAAARAEREATEARARAEREEAERAAAEERARNEEAQRQAAEAARIEREALEAKAKAEKDAADAVALKERQLREKVEAEVREKERIETERLKVEAEAARRAANAPDRMKLLVLADELSQLDMPEMATDEGRAALAQSTKEIARVVAWINERAAKL